MSEKEKNKRERKVNENSKVDNNARTTTLAVIII
jgi:hypothetical protein